MEPNPRVHTNENTDAQADKIIVAPFFLLLVLLLLPLIPELLRQ